MLHMCASDVRKLHFLGIFSRRPRFLFFFFFVYSSLKAINLETANYIVTNPLQKLTKNRSATIFTQEDISPEKNSYVTTAIIAETICGMTQPLLRP